MFYFCFDCENTTPEDELISVDEQNGIEILLCPFCESCEVMQVDDPDELYV